MLTKVVVVVLMVAATLAEEQEGEREKRQVGCPSTFQLASNPCQSIQGRVYYPVAGDNTKFVQCDVLGRAYVIQCPTGLTYNEATTSCQSQVVAASTAAPVSGPCTPQAIQSGNIYFPYAGDNTRFYECVGINQAQVLTCPSGLIWDNSRVACMYPGGTGVGQGPITIATVIPTTQTFTNPCTLQQLSSRHYYFAHPDPTKFIQCDNIGEAFVVQCPGGLVWNQYAETCASPFTGLTSVVG